MTERFSGYDAIELAQRFGLTLKHRKSGVELDVAAAKELAEQDEEYVILDADLNALDGAVTGVVSNNTPEWLWDEVDQGIDLAWIEHLQTCQGRCANCHCTHLRAECKCSEPRHDYDPTNEHDFCGPEERGSTLIGDWKKDAKGDYEPDQNGKQGYSAIVRELVTQVVWSKYKKFARWCSPCYPNQGDLDSTGTAALCYDLPPEIYGEGNE